MDHPVGPVEWVISDAPADPSHARSIRRALAQWLTATVFDDHARRDITLAVYEALANAVEHAYVRHPNTGTMTARAAYSHTRGVLQVSVTDHGRWRPSTPASTPMRGNGILLMNALSEDTSIDHTEEGTTVVMSFPVAVAPPFTSSVNEPLS